MQSYNTGASLVINNSTFTSSQGIVVNVVNNQSAGPDSLQILNDHIAVGALFNSDERFDPPKCHPETRTAILNSIYRWARGEGEGRSKPILWLRGPAGAGKSAIAQTSAERWEDAVLAASFFFSRTVFKRNQKRSLISTIAYQIWRSIPATQHHILSAIQTDIGIFNQNLRTQMMRLVVRPVIAAMLTSPYVIIIDGLDECSQDTDGQDHEAQQREILDAILFAVQQQGFPIRFLVASRPERQIRTSFQRDPLRSLTYSIVLDNTHNPKADIHLFITCKFDEIKEIHPYVEPSWPSESAINLLVKKSSGQFIYPAVAMRYLGQPRADPRESLETITKIGPSSTEEEEIPFAELDTLYAYILSTITPRSRPWAIKIFEFLCLAEMGRPNWIVNPQSPDRYICHPQSPYAIERFTFLPPGHAYLHLIDLHSLIEVPPQDKSTTMAISFIHASFSEFLMNPSRSGSFAMDEPQARLRLLQSYFKHVLIQALSPDGGASAGYVGDRGCILELRAGLRYHNPPPCMELAEGLAALVGEDEGRFAQYVQSVNLAHMGYTRNEEIVKHLCHPNHINTVMKYLQRCSIVEGVKPLSLTSPTSLVFHGSDPDP